ncbi:MAG: hypothetical protein DWC02_00380 [Candidatus Poseidoniales archaeon]|nr:MAG: hypothetical protein DWC02_00380 [Candidatus Poseidoniales archaeon]
MDEDLDQDSDDYEIEELVENVTDCPGCGEACGHEVLREKKAGTGADYLLKCDECAHVHTVQMRPPRGINVPFLLSEGSQTVVVNIEIDDDEILVLGDIFEYAEASWEINRIENKESNPVKKLVALEVGRVNAVRSDVVMVRLTLTRGEFSDSDAIFVERETIFRAGSIMDHGGEKWKIRAIHTGNGRTMTGRVVAHDIKRIYLHEPPRPEDEFIPRTPRERRQAWKEGKLGDNPNPILPDAEKSGKPKQQRPGRRRRKKRN